MVMSDEQLVAKQAALNKALSTAYLKHQISELESQVQAVGLGADRTFSLTKGPSIRQQDLDYERRSKDRQHHDDHGHDEDDSHHHHHRRRHHGPRRYGRIDDSDEDEDDASETTGSSSSCGSSNRRIRRQQKEVMTSNEWRLAVVDVSALMWAPKTIRSLVSRGWEVVVPLEAIRTLDILKKGNSPSAIAARAATRYIEHAGRFFQILPDSAADSTLFRGRGLRIQRDEEVQPIVSMGDLIPIDKDGMPKWVHSVLSCAAYFVTLNEKAAAEEAAANKSAEKSAEVTNVNDETRSMSDRDATFDGEEEEGPRPALYIAHPPISAEVGPPVVDERPPEARREGTLASIDPNVTYAERGEGYRISQEAERFEFFLEVLRDDDEDEDNMMLADRGGRRRNRRRNGGRGENRGEGRGQGRGGGSGGRGGRGSGRGKGRGDKGRNKIKEPEREVKILLRRPEASPASATRSLEPSDAQVSIPAPLPVSAPLPPCQPQITSTTSKPNKFKLLSKPVIHDVLDEKREADGQGVEEARDEKENGVVFGLSCGKGEEYGGRGGIYRGGGGERGGPFGRGRGGRGRRGGRSGDRGSDTEGSSVSDAAGGGGRGGRRGGGRNRNRRNRGEREEGKGKDKGGNFTLLQRPGPPLAHHVHAISPEIMTSPRDVPPPLPPGPPQPPGGGQGMQPPSIPPPHLHPHHHHQDHYHHPSFFPDQPPHHRGHPHGRRPPLPLPFAPRLLARPRPPPPLSPEFGLHGHDLPHGHGHGHGHVHPPPPPPVEFEPYANSDHAPPALPPVPRCAGPGNDSPHTSPRAVGGPPWRESRVGGNANRGRGGKTFLLQRPK